MQADGQHLCATPACLRLLPRSHPRQEAEQVARERGWAVAPDGDSFRRVVASPLPRDIVEWRAIRTLLQVRAGSGACRASS